MSSIKIATWNSQGDPSPVPAKKEVLERLLRECHVVLIQECGDLARTWRGGGTIHASPHIGAFNNRCNSCILSQIPFQRLNSWTLPSSNGRRCTYGWCQPSENISLIVATLHANAWVDAAYDGRQAVNTLHQRHPGQDFIVGGDFNREPISLTGRTRRVRVGTRTRGADFQLATCNLPTHSRGRELDFFIRSPALTTRFTRRYHLWGGSDHCPVLTTISYPDDDEDSAGPSGDDVNRKRTRPGGPDPKRRRVGPASGGRLAGIPALPSGFPEHLHLQEQERSRPGDEDEAGDRFGAGGEAQRPHGHEVAESQRRERGRG